MQIIGTPPVVKNLLIINGLMALATLTLYSLGIELNEILGMPHFSSDSFQVYQLVTYMFMHAPLYEANGFMHILINMFILWMFGKYLEYTWGSKRFLIFYIVCGIGAGLVQQLFYSIDIQLYINAMEGYLADVSPQNFELFIEDHFPAAFVPEFYDQLVSPWMDAVDGTDYERESIYWANKMLEAKRDTSTVGASGSIFGILLGMAMYFPNERVMLLFPPIPMKMKYMVILLGFIELTTGVVNHPADNVAHFAHLGGMLFGYFVILYWKRFSNTNRWN